MVFRDIQQIIEALPQPHEDIEYLEQKFQAYYYTPNDEWREISIHWNTRQYIVVFKNENNQRSLIDVERNFQITLREVLALRGINIHRIVMIDAYNNNIQNINAILNQSIENMPVVGASIWSHDDPEDVPNDHEFIYHPLPNMSWGEAVG